MPPLVPIALGLIVGIILNETWPAPVGAYAGVAAILCAILLIRTVRQRYATAIGCALAVCLGGIRHDTFVRRVEPCHIARFVSDESVYTAVTGTVVTPPYESSPDAGFFTPWMHRRHKTRFTLAVDHIEGRSGLIAVCGRLRVTVAGPPPTIRAGDRIRIFGSLAKPFGPVNPGQFNYRRWLRRHGILAVMYCNGPGNISAVARERNALLSAWQSARDFARQALVGPDQHVDDDASGLVETMVLGRRYAVSERVEDAFRRTGTTHLLSVSGVHVGVVAGFVWFLGWCVGVRRRQLAIIVALTMIAFAMLVDPRPPIFRATVIGVVYCVGIMLRRKTVATNSLALAAIILLTIRPTGLFEPGFQMSFAGVLGIIHLREPIRRALAALCRRWLPTLPTDPLALGRTPRYERWLLHAAHSTLALASVSTAACLASTPLVLPHFGRIAPLSPINTIVLFPFFSITLILGVIRMGAEVVVPLAGPVCDAALAFAAHILLRVVDLIDFTSLSLGGRFATLAMVAYVLLLIVIIAAIRVGDETLFSMARAKARRFFRTYDGRINRPRAAGVVVMIMVAASIVVLAVRPDRGNDLRVTVLSVGRGTSAVIRFPDGTTWLFDCGTNRSFDVGARTIVPYLAAVGIHRVDRILVSHPNLDHFSGLFSVINALPVGPVTVNRHFRRFAGRIGPASAMLDELDSRAHRIERVEQLLPLQTPDGVRVELLWPPETLPDRAQTNDTSTVVRLTYQGRSVLFCGDIEEPALRMLLTLGDLAADVLVLPHHGGWVRSSTRFLAAVDPVVCLMSSDRKRSDLREQYSDALGDRPLFTTAELGAVTLMIGDARMTVSGARRGGVVWSQPILRGESAGGATIIEAEAAGKTGNSP